MKTPPSVASSLRSRTNGWRVVGLTLGFFFGVVGTTRASEDFFDRVEDALTVSTDDGRTRARLSGTLDLEDYRFSRPAPALLQVADGRLFNPRLALFLDAQFGERAYVFAQTRVDRGFDPVSGGSTQVRLDEYALRVRLGATSPLTVQVGKFATVVGNWTARHNSWTDPFVTAPLPYENLTGVWDSEIVRTPGTLLQWSHVRPGLPAHITAVEKSLRLPIVWGPSYATGAALFGEAGKFRFAFEVKHAALSSRPEAWSRLREAWEKPTVSARLGYRPNVMWNLGVSASAGPYLRPFVAVPTNVGAGRGNYRQLVIAQDASFAWHHLQLWSEIYAARFEIPRVGHADTLAYYAEAKYKFTPRFFGALRWNQQLFGTIPEAARRTRWGQNADRADVGGGFRFTPNVQAKVQYNLQHGDTGSRAYGRTLATQITVKF